MPNIVWKVRQVEDGYQAFVRVTSDLLKEESGNWFSVKETRFVNEISARAAAQETAYRLGLKLAARESGAPAVEITIEKAE